MIILTDSCVKQIKRLRDKQGKPDLNLRLTVDGGGCQGFEYRFEFAGAPEPDDTIFEKDGVGVVIDSISLPYLDGSEIDYTDDLIGAAFKVNNPNAASSCGCGTSFSMKD